MDFAVKTKEILLNICKKVRLPLLAWVFTCRTDIFMRL